MKFFRPIIKHCLVIFVISVYLSSCTKSSDSTSTSNTTNASVKLDTMNVTYGLDAAQKMDIYLPPNRSDANTKVFVMIHGGAWTAGDKSDFNSTIPSVQSGLGNYAVININYRLAVPPSTNLWPTQINDVNTAFDYIVANANYYHFNPNKIVVMGASAGAHLGLLKAYKYNSDKKIKAVVDYFGPTDMADLYNFQVGIQKQLFELFMGGTPTSAPTTYTNASPLFSVATGVPPTIIFHGTADAVVPLSQSTRLKTALQTAGVVQQYTEYAGEGHGVFNSTNTLDAYNKFVAFCIANNP
jgi:acetyl esterase/lipase